MAITVSRLSQQLNMIVTVSADCHNKLHNHEINHVSKLLENKSDNGIHIASILSQQLNNHDANIVSRPSQQINYHDINRFSRMSEKVIITV